LQIGSQSQLIGPTSSACTTVIDLQGPAGTGRDDNERPIIGCLIDNPQRNGNPNARTTCDLICARGASLVCG
jgi:hypothetical protein